jgi:hypothetical protein
VPVSISTPDSTPTRTAITSVVILRTSYGTRTRGESPLWPILAAQAGKREALGEALEKPPAWFWRDPKHTGAS